LAATQEAADKITSKIQEQIDDQRQARENEKAEESIADKSAQLSYLAMDTSGAGALA
jgi:hypothetical protein